MKNANDILSQILGLADTTPKSDEEMEANEKKLAEMRCKSMNAEVGHLDEKDGYNCSLCLNRGYWSKPHKNGRFYNEIMVICKCQTVRKSIALMEKSGLKSVVKEYRFENYEATEDWQKAMWSKAKAFADAEDGKWLFFGGSSGCVDCDTEYFNGNKWNKISDYDGGKVLQYNPITKEATLVKPQNYIVNECERLYEISTIRGSVNMCLSQDHSFAYITSKGNMIKKPFYEIMKRHEQKPFGFNGRIETSFKYSGKGIALNESEIRLMCAVIADGHFRKKTKLCYVNVKKDRKKERMRLLLDGIEHKEYKKKNGYSVFVFYAPRTEKEFSEYWYNCSNEQLKIICDEVFNWDGTINGVRKSFFSNSKKSADFVQFALSSIGKRATIRVDSHKEKPSYVVICSSGGSTVSLTSASTYTKAEITAITPKDGKEYCFTVDTGYLVLRRGDRIFITGNCGKTHLCTAVCTAFLRKGKAVKYMLWRDEAGRLKSLVNDEEYGDNIAEYKEVDVLYIDDLFKTGKSADRKFQMPTQGDINLAFEILNNRAMSGKTTIISTECTLPELIEIDEAIAGRIKQMSGDYCMSIAKDRNKNYRLR